jgi:catechol 2,3-dioxygenase-like lactoylglutathione lyase family enzyme
VVLEVAMRGVALFTAGVGLGILLMQSVAAQSSTQSDAGMKLNHVGIAVKNFDEAVAYYTKSMGFREAFSFREPNGQPILAYLQISRDTFLEIQPATAEQPAGFSHLGIEMTDGAATVARLRRSGIKVGDLAAGHSGAPLTNVFDSEGIRSELLELGPASLQRKAMNAWK